MFFRRIVIWACCVVAAQKSQKHVFSLTHRSNHVSWIIVIQNTIASNSRYDKKGSHTTQHAYQVVHVSRLIVAVLSEPALKEKRNQLTQAQSNAEHART